MKLQFSKGLEHAFVTCLLTANSVAEEVFPKTLPVKLEPPFRAKQGDLKINGRAGKKKHQRDLASKIPKQGTPEKCKLLRLEINRALRCSCGIYMEDR